VSQPNASTTLQRAGLLALLLAVPLASQTRPPADAAPDAGAGPPEVRLTADEAQAAARAALAEVNVEVADGLELSLWASRDLLIDPVAMDFDPDGVMYLTSTTRNDLPLDIRGHRDWMTLAHTLRTLPDLRAFYLKVMAPERSDENTWIDDLNGDGSRDYRDLEEMKERIYRLEDSDGDGIADRSRIVIEGFNDDPTWDIAGSVVRHGGDLIVGIPPGVYRLRDADGDGYFEVRETIAEGFYTHPTYGGHGVSGVMFGPDGRLYWEVGDMGMHVVDREGRTWAYPNQGVVARSEVDGSGFEVFATGIRNLQEFAFDDHGNLISVDNDGDHQGESERLVYIPYGSDSGWRSNWQYGKYTDEKNNTYNVWMAEEMFRPRHKGQAAHIVPPIASWHAGPSGMAYNPGTALSEEWRDHFFVSSFPGSAANAHVYAFTLKEDGAGFAMDRERVLLRGILTVGLKIGPDGALYLTDWIRGWDSKEEGQIWKIDAPSEAGSAMRREVQSLLKADFGSSTGADLAALLRHADMRVRQKAQFELAGRGDTATLLASARDTSSRHARLHGLWGVAQVARRSPERAADLLPFLDDPEGEIRAQAARLLGDVRYAGAAEALVPLLEDQAPRARFFAAEALGRLRHRPALEPIVRMLADNDGGDALLHHAGSLALASIGDAEAVAALRTHRKAPVRLAAVVALRRMRDAAVAQFLDDRDRHVALEAARAINDDGGIEAAVPALAASLAPARARSEAFARRAINANLRVGDAEAVQRVAAVAGDARVPDAIRIEAVATLGIWGDPSPLDRVDGYYHDVFTVRPAAGDGRLAPTAASRDVEAARRAMRDLVARLDAAGPRRVSDDLRIALAAAIGNLGMTEFNDRLLAQLRDDPSAEVRVAAFDALRRLDVTPAQELMATAVADADATVRRRALTVLPDVPLSEEARTKYAADVFARGTILEQQGVLEVLGRLGSESSRAALARHLDDLAAGRLAPALHIDLLEAVQEDGDAALLAKVEAFQQQKNAASLQEAFRDGLAYGGDARRGRRVFSQNPSAECSRCHATASGEGGDVGPNLAGVGSRLTREELVEALIAPSARIAPGYGLVSVTLRNGTQVSGILRDETDTHLTLLVADPGATTPPGATSGVERTVEKAAIAERSDPISAMPPLGLLLEPREVRDLVEYLARLK
jgi:quinoprotein glucose dehydrogenase